MSYQESQGAPAAASADFFSTLSGGLLPDGVGDLAKDISRTGTIFAKGFKASEGIPVVGTGLTPQTGFCFSGTEGDSGLHSFAGVSGAIGLAINGAIGATLRAASGGSAWTLNAGPGIADVQNINAYHYVNGGGIGGTTVATRIDVSNPATGTSGLNSVSVVLKNNNVVSGASFAGIIGSSDVANPGGEGDLGAYLGFWRGGSATNNNHGFGISTRSALGISRRLNIYPSGLAAFDTDATLTGLIWQTARGGVAGLQVNHNGTSFQVLGASAYGIISDRRYKDDIKPLDRALVNNAFKGIQASSWVWNEDAKTECGNVGSSNGFIAQNVKEFFPDAVCEVKENTLAVMDTKLIPLLWSQVQALTAELRELKTQLGA